MFGANSVNAVFMAKYRILRLFGSEVSLSSEIKNPILDSPKETHRECLCLPQIKVLISTYPVILAVKQQQQQKILLKVPPRFKHGSPDSESRVLSITPWDRSH